MYEGEQLEQIEPGKIGIAQPLADYGRAEQDDRRIRRHPHRLPAPQHARLAIGRGEPDTGMAGVQGGEG